MANAAVVKETCIKDKSISFVVGPFVAIPMQQDKATAEVTNFIKEENGRFYLREGAIWPSNDENAQGIVAWDKDITDGAVTFSLIVDATVRTELLPVEPTAEALAALRKIGVLPVIAPEIPDSSDQT